MVENDYDALARFLNPKDNPAGRRSVVTPEETQAIESKIKGAASRGPAIDYDALRSVSDQIASDGRLSYSTSTRIPSNDVIRRRRVYNTDINYRKAEGTQVTKLCTEQRNYYVPKPSLLFFSFLSLSFLLISFLKFFSCSLFSTTYSPFVLLHKIQFLNVQHTFCKLDLHCKYPQKQACGAILRLRRSHYPLCGHVCTY